MKQARRRLMCKAGIFTFLLAAGLALACNEPRQQPVSIDLQPFTDFPEKLTGHIYSELKKMYPHVNVLKPIPLPDQAYYVPRKRFRADSLIHFLRRNTARGHVSLGLTSKDISSSKGEIRDYGIMGLGFRPGTACVVSSFRLSKSNLSSQLFKVAVHELGHTQGLNHCDHESCYMRDAEGGNPTEEEQGFCKSCKTYLMERGWVF